VRVGWGAALGRFFLECVACQSCVLPRAPVLPGLVMPWPPGRAFAIDPTEPTVEPRREHVLESQNGCNDGSPCSGSGVVADRPPSQAGKQCKLRVCSASNAS
jgi:hypothetical protein